MVNGTLVLNSDEIRERYVSANDEMTFMILTDCSDVEPGEGNPEGLTAVEIDCSYTEASDEYFFTAPHYPVITDLRLGNGKGSSAAMLGDTAGGVK